MRNYKDLNDFGMIATLHTFGRPLNWNPHIHCLIPELSYNSSKNHINISNILISTVYVKHGSMKSTVCCLITLKMNLSHL